MTDPRTRIGINRTIASRPPDAHSTPTGLPQPPARRPIALPSAATTDDELRIAPIAPSEPRMIGKRHGRMRSVGVYLTPSAEQNLRERAGHLGATLGEVAIVAVRQFDLASTLREPNLNVAGRTGPRPRRGTGRAAIVYLLLTPEEASELAERTSEHGTTVSDLVSKALIASVIDLGGQQRCPA